MVKFVDNKIEWALELKNKGVIVSNEMEIIIELCKKVLELEKRIKELKKK